MMLLLGHRPPAHHAISYSRNDQTITITYLPTYHVKCQSSYLKSLYPALKLYQSTGQTREEWEGSSDLGGCSVWGNELPR